jgi:branched-chain amino acid transport system ATP-binding protein
VSAFTVTYDELVAVRDVSITVGRGEVIALIGPNGAGKSSILRGISGVARVRSGSALFMGRDIVGLRPWEIAERGIAHVVEGRGIFPGLTVEQNVSLGAMVSRSALTHQRESRDMVYSLFPELASRRQQSGGSLSGGQQQMLAIGRGIMAQPSLLILDEPSLGLSPLLAATVFEKLQAMKDFGTAMIVVEQNSALACEVADRLYLLRAGHVRRECDASDAGSLEELMGVYLGTVEEEGKIS